MKYNWKRLAALLLAVILMLSLSGVSEEEFVIDNDLPILEDIELSESLNDLDIPILNTDLQQPVNDEIITPEDDIDVDITSNALVTKVKIGVKEKYTINTSSLSGKLTFTSSKAAVATVTKKGVITGKKVGTAKITIKTSKGKKYTVTVTVAKAPSKVTLNKKTATLEVGDTLQLKAKLPSKTASNKITWTSSNKNVATVSNKGKVTAKGEGTATITVKTFNGKKARCKLTVTDPEPEEPVLSADPTSVKISVGQSYSVTITYLNDNTIEWDVGNSSIATCKWGDGWDGDTCQLIITGASAGSTTVTVRDTVTQDYVDIYVTVTGSSGYTGDLLGAYGMDFDEFNSVIDNPLSYYDYDDGSYYYTNAYMMIVVSASTNKIEGIMLTSKSSKYTLTGVYPGMSLSSAQATATSAGWSYNQVDGDNYWYRATYQGKSVALIIKKDSYSSTVQSVTML